MPCLLQILLSLHRGIFRRFAPPMRLSEHAFSGFKCLSLHFLPRDVVHFSKDFDVFLLDSLDVCLLLRLVLVTPRKHLEFSHAFLRLRTLATFFWTIYQCLWGLHSRLIKSDISSEVEGTGQLRRGSRMECGRLLKFGFLQRLHVGFPIAFEY